MNPAQLLLAAQLDRDQARRDPLATTYFASEAAREMARQVCLAREVYVRSGLRAGKTSAGARLGLCFARGIGVIDARTILEVRRGEPVRTMELPRVRVPTTGYLIVPSYKQAQDSSVAIYRRLIGTHPHHLLRGAGGMITEIRVKPDVSRSDDFNDWSKIVLYPRDGELPRGTAPDWIHGDEIPSEETWRQARARIDASKTLYLWITATPEYQEEWAWLRADYDSPADWRTEIVLSVYDNQALGKRQLKLLEAKYSNDPLRDARLRGDYVNLKGSNPFRHQHHHLEMLEEECKDAPWEESVLIKSEVRTHKGMRVQDAFADVFIWAKPVRGEKYYLPCDPSQGVADGDHDPCGGHVYSEGLMGPKMLVARYNGFCGGFGLGFLMGLLAERYNDGMVDVENNGGYGATVLTALGMYKSERHPNGYPHVSHDIDPTKQNEWQIKHGFTTNEVNKAEMIESIRWALIHRPILVYSGATIRCLKEAVMDRAGRLDKPEGVHYEDLICFGRACYRHYIRGQIKPPAPKLERPERHVLAPRGTQRIRQPFSRMPWSRS